MLRLFGKTLHTVHRVSHTLPKNPHIYNVRPFFGPISSFFKNAFLQAMKHCEEAHAHAIAQNMGIDFKGIQFRVEKNKVISLIDAPNASQEKVKLLAERIEQECPMAMANNFMKQFEIEWRKK